MLVTIPAAAEGPKGTKIQRQEVSRSAAANKRIETRRVPENIPGEDRPNTLAGAGKTYLVRTDLIPSET